MCQPIAAAGRFTYHGGNGIASTTLAAFAAGLVLVAATTTAEAHDCTCRYAGADYQQGETACIRDKIARCAMYLNNSSWTFLAQSCPQVRAPGERMTPVPVETASR